MEIKIGQYVRREDNRIFKGLPAFKNGYDNWENKQSCLAYHLVKVATTPQELIEVGDLISGKGFGFGLIEITCEEDLRIILKDCQDVTKILTPNEDKTVYTCQWEAE